MRLIFTCTNKDEQCTLCCSSSLEKVRRRKTYNVVDSPPKKYAYITDRRRSDGNLVTSWCSRMTFFEEEEPTLPLGEGGAGYVSTTAEEEVKLGQMSINKKKQTLTSPATDARRPHFLKTHHHTWNYLLLNDPPPPLPLHPVYPSPVGATMYCPRPPAILSLCVTLRLGRRTPSRNNR